ncbi:MAG: hypothetical protein WC627_06915 [Legionella sp.]|jgi:hypothetical protein
MKFTAKLVLQELPGRQFNVPGAIKVVTDFFLGFEILTINDETVTTTQSAFNLLKKSFPSVKVGNEEIKIENAKLPPGTKDVPHATVFHTPDFRYNRELSQEVDMDKVARAKAIVEDYKDELITFEVPDDKAFEFISTSVEHYTLINSSAAVKLAEYAPGTKPFLGRDRDGVLEIALPEAIKAKVLEIGRKVCKDPTYEVWNQNKFPVGYHITVGEANGVNAKLEAEAAAIAAKQNNVVTTEQTVNSL